MTSLCVAKIKIPEYVHECECTNSRNHPPDIAHICLICSAWWQGNRVIRRSPYLG